MAENSRDELNNRREQSKVEKEINRATSARESAYKESVKSAGDALDISRQITEDIKDQLGMVRAKSEADIGALSLARKLQQSAQLVTTELGNQGKIQRQIINDTNLVSSIRTEISNIDSKIGEEGAIAAGKIAKSLTKQQNIQREIEEIKAEMLTLDEEQKKNAQADLKNLGKKLVKQEKIIKDNEELLALNGQYEAGDVRRLIQLKQQEGIGEEIIRQRKHELDLQRKIEDHTGVTGALVEGVGGIMQRLGMRSGIFQNAMELSAETMKDMSEETIRTKEGIAKAEAAMKGLEEGTAEYNKALKNLEAAKLGNEFNKVQIALAGATELAKGFRKALFDPLTVVLAIVDGFFDVNKAATEFTQLTGMPSDEMAGVNTRLSTTVDLLNQSASLTKELGLNASAIFTPDQVGQISDIKTLLGLSEAAAGRLGLMMKTTGQPAEQIRDSISDTVSNLNDAGKSAIAPRQVLDDVLGASEDIAASLGNNPKALAAAATAAKQFGMNLAQVDRIAGSLMDFESSIEAELEAQLLTGKNINMSKARELALNNDLAGLAKELKNQGVDAVEFSKMNRIQQEATAKALGMSRQELAKSVLTQEAMASMTDEQIAKARGVSLAESERIDIQERIQKGMQSLAQAFAPILEAIVPVVETLSTIIQPIAAGIGFVAKLIASFLKLTPVVNTVKAAILGIAAVKFVSLTSGIVSGIKNMAALTAQMRAFRIAQAKGLSDKQILAGFGGKAAQQATQMTMGQTIALKANNAVRKVSIVLQKAYTATTNALTAGITRLIGTERMKAIQLKVNNAVIAVGTAMKKAYAATTNFLSASLTKLISVEKMKAIQLKLSSAYEKIALALGKSKILMAVKERAATIAKTTATVAGTVAEKAKLAAEKVSLVLGRTRIGQYLAEKAAIAATTAAKWLGFGATQALNGAAATSATTGAAGGAGMAAFAAGLTALTPAIPVILAIGAALLLASPAIYAFGLAIKAAFDGIANVVTAVGGAISMMLDKITLEKAVAMGVMGLSFISLAGGLLTLSAAVLFSIPAIGMLGAIALMGPGLLNAGNGMEKMAAGVAALSEALKTLEVEKLDNLKDFTVKAAVAGIAASGLGAIGEMVSNIAGDSAGENDELLARVDQLIAAVEQDRVTKVYMNGNQMSMQLVQENPRQG